MIVEISKISVFGEIFSDETNWTICNSMHCPTWGCILCEPLMPLHTAVQAIYQLHYSLVDQSTMSVKYYILCAIHRWQWRNFSFHNKAAGTGCFAAVNVGITWDFDVAFNKPQYGCLQTNDTNKMLLISHFTQYATLPHNMVIV